MIAGRSLQGWLDLADRLGAEGRFFEAHEELEIAWKAADGDVKILLQGLIQISAGLHRWQLDPKKTEGAFYLLERGLDKLERTRLLVRPETLAGLIAALKTARAAAAAPRSLRGGLRAVRS